MTSPTSAAQPVHSKLAVTLRALLIPLFLALHLSAQAQLPLGGHASKTPAPAKAATPDKPAEQRAQTEALLADAQKQLEAASAGNENSTLPSEQQRLLERLVGTYGERLKLLDDLAASRAGKSDPTGTAPDYNVFSGPPPYSVLLVDALRRDFDTANERHAGLISSARALASQKRAQIELQKRAQEAVRRGEDRVARARSDSEKEKEREALALAGLRLQLSDAELNNIALAEQRIGIETASAAQRVTEYKELITRVLPKQRFSPADFQRQQSYLRDTQARLSGEIDRRLAENSRRTTERERMARNLGDPADPETTRRLKLLDEALENDRIVLMTLNWQQALGQFLSEAWQARFDGLSAQDAQARQKAVGNLKTIHDELQTRRPLIAELETAIANSMRDQEQRLQGLPPEDPNATYEKSVLDLLKQRLEAFQRLSAAADRFDHQLDRWLTEDFGVKPDASGEYWQIAYLELLQKLKAIWNFEMFAVEDSTVVEGKTVTVTYGVTIGKSIGALLLFVLGYWLFSRVARRLQRVMVERFGVDEQLAGVIRRWAMISLGLVLLVFILNLARIPLTVFAFMGGALAIGIGFGTQTIIKNVISGIIILFERKIRVGDIIQLGGTTGHVTAVDLRASTVRGFDGVEALVPNSSFLENQVINWTYSNARVRREIRVGVAYGSPIHAAADIVAGCAEDHGQVLKDPPPAVFFEDFGDNALMLALVYWVELGPNTVTRRIDSDLRFAIEKRLKDANIAIPFPQREIRLTGSETIPVQVVVPPSGPGDAPR